jgi:hypothetical protein
VNAADCTSDSIDALTLAAPLMSHQPRPSIQCAQASESDAVLACAAGLHHARCACRSKQTQADAEADQDISTAAAVGGTDGTAGELSVAIVVTDADAEVRLASAGII